MTTKEKFQMALDFLGMVVIFSVPYLMFWAAYIFGD